MRWGIVTIASIVILIPLGCWLLGPWTVLRIIGALVLGVIVFGTGLLGYICLRAQAITWAVGFLALAGLCALGIYWIIGL